MRSGDRTLPSSPAALLRQLGLRARKGYSQSFLTDVRLTEQIAKAAELGPDDEVVEIGPGLGILTRTLARHARRVVAIELDRELAAALPRLVPSNVEIVQGDALQVDLGEHWSLGHTRSSQTCRIRSRRRFSFVR